MDLNFYTIVVIVLALIAIGIGVANYYYSKKWISSQNKKGIAAQPLSRLINNVIKNGYSSTTPINPKNREGGELIPYKVRKYFNLRNLNILFNIVTIILIAIQNENWWIMLILQTVVNVIIYTPSHQARNKIIKRMTEAAYKKLMWGNRALVVPWNYIQVQEWEKDTPVKIRLTLPTEFDATLPGTRDSFERAFNSVVSNSNNWSYTWDTGEGHIELIPVALLPEKSSYEGSSQYPWHVFPIGLGQDGPVTYDISSHPHVLVGGTTGSGKSVLQRNIIFHCIQHNNMWRFLGVDLKRVELGPFKRYEKTVMGVASELEDGVEVVRYAQRVMNTRYAELEEAGVNHFKDLIDPRTGKTKHHALLVMVDEAAMFMGSEGVKTDDGKARDELHGEAVGIIGALARLGRAAGVHLVLATQRPDATFIPGETKANLDVRIAAGRLDSTPSSMILDSTAATLLPGNIKGRGVIRYAGQNQEFQGYFADPSWIDEWLEKNPGVEPTVFPSGEGPLLEAELSDLDVDIDFDDGILELEADATGAEAIDSFATAVVEELKKETELSDNIERKKKESKFKRKGGDTPMTETDSVEANTEEGLTNSKEDAGDEKPKQKKGFFTKKAKTPKAKQTIAPEIEPEEDFDAQPESENNALATKEFIDAPVASMSSPLPPKLPASSLPKATMPSPTGKINSQLPPLTAMKKLTPLTPLPKLPTKSSE